MKQLLYSLCCAAAILCASPSAQSQSIVQFAGSAISGPGYTGDGGLAINAQLYHPKSVAFDDTGNAYIADVYNNCIRKVDVSNGFISTFCGVVAGGFAGDGGPARFASFDHPDYVVLDQSNNVYICDANNQRIRKVDAVTGNVNTIVGDGNAGYIGDGGAATAAEINYPSAIAIDPSGNLLIADQGNNVIRKVDATTGVISTIAGTGNTGYSGEGGPATAADLGFPYGLVVDHAGNIYVGLYFESRVCKINTSGIITTYAGVGGGTGMGRSGDGGPATAATLDGPWGLGMDGAGNLYIGDDNNDVVRKVDASGTITTFAGTGSYGYAGDGGPATAAKFKDPIGFAVGADGSLYIADYNNHEIRRVLGTLTHPPMFTGGHSQTTTACESGPAISINSLLSVSDADAGQTEYWSTAMAPSHGTLAASYSTTSTGGTLTPAGLTYTPTAGYAGNDTFKVRIYDGTASDTTRIVVTISPCGTPPTFVNGDNQTMTVCKNASAASLAVPLSVSDADMGQTETWSTVMAPSHGTLVAAYSTTSTGSILVPTGLSYTPATGYTGTDMFSVMVSDGTRADTATFTVTINDCSTGVAGLNGSGEGISAFPNPNTGSFSLALSSPVAETVHVTVVNMMGEKVKELDMATNAKTDITLATTGIYFINAVTAHGHWNTKVTITK